MIGPEAPGVVPSQTSEVPMRALSRKLLDSESTKWRSTPTKTSTVVEDDHREQRSYRDAMASVGLLEAKERGTRNVVVTDVCQVPSP